MSDEQPAEVELIPDPRNARLHPKENQEMIRKSLEEVGAFRSIAIDGDNIIRAGNGVFEQAQQLGLKVKVVEAAPDELIAVKRPDLTGEKAERAAMYDNRTGELSEWDADVLLWLKDNEPQVVDSLFTKEEWREFADQSGDSGAEPPADPGPEIDRAEELRIKWGVESGQLWRCGDHFLICGDSANPEIVSKVMGGAEFDCLWTDPPYGVNYVGKTIDALTIENDSEQGLEDLLVAVFSNINLFMKNGAPFYIAGPPGRQSWEFTSAIRKIPGWLWHETLVWVKDSMVLGHSDYHYQHENIYYGWRGANRSWYAGRDQTTVFHIPRPKRSQEHPTMKPVELIEAHLLNSTCERDVVFDPFVGSGSTIIACERLRRCCRAIDKDPAYVAVCLERFFQMTGRKAELLK